MAEMMALLGSSNDDLYTELFRDNLENRVLVFNEDVNESLIENYMLYIMKWNREDKGLPVECRRPITILLSSLGGDCFVGFGGMVNCIEQSKTPIRVVGIGLIASMAFHIFIACPERYAFSDSILLMHDGEKAAQSSGSKFKDVVKFFDSMDARTKAHVLKYTKMSEEFYDEHLEREFYMYADEAKKLGCVDYIIGEDCNLDDVL